MWSPGLCLLFFALALAAKPRAAMICSDECTLRIATLEAEVRALRTRLLQSGAGDAGFGSAAETERIFQQKTNLMQGNCPSSWLRGIPVTIDLCDRSAGVCCLPGAPPPPRIQYLWLCERGWEVPCTAHLTAAALPTRHAHTMYMLLLFVRVSCMHTCTRARSHV